MTNIDQNVVSASVESIISERPKMFKTDDGVIGVAVLGVLMPYHIFVMAMIASLHNMQSLTGSLDSERDKKLIEHMHSLYRGVEVPERFSRWFKRMPWDGANEAVKEMMAQIRQSDTSKADIIAMLTEVEETYCALYVPPTPPYYTLKAVQQPEPADVKKFVDMFMLPATCSP